jgi:hypothetical protein
MEAFTRLLVTAAIRILEGIFVLGILGSALVLILGSVQDIRDLFKKDVSAEKETH